MNVLRHHMKEDRTTWWTHARRLLKNEILATNYDEKCSEREHSKILIVVVLSEIFREFCIAMQPIVNNESITLLSPIS